MKLQRLNKLALLLVSIVSYCGVAVALPRYTCPSAAELRQAVYSSPTGEPTGSVFRLRDGKYQGNVIVLPYATQQTAEAALQTVTRSYPVRITGVKGVPYYCMYAPFDNADLSVPVPSSYHYTFVAFIPMNFSGESLLDRLVSVGR